MEPTNPFNLSKAIETWQMDLRFQGNLPEDDIKELHSHLLDEIDCLIKKGLSGEESYWIAQKRMGNIKILGEEFQKIQPYHHTYKGLLIVIISSIIALIISDLIDVFSQVTSLFFLLNSKSQFIIKLLCLDVFLMIASFFAIKRLLKNHVRVSHSFSSLLNNRPFTILFYLLLIEVVVFILKLVATSKIKIVKADILYFLYLNTMTKWHLIGVFILMLLVVFYLITQKNFKSNTNQLMAFFHKTNLFVLVVSGWLGWILLLAINFSFFTSVLHFNGNYTFLISGYLFHIGFGLLIEGNRRYILTIKLFAIVFPAICWCVSGIIVNPQSFIDKNLALIVFTNSFLSASIGLGIGHYLRTHKQIHQSV